MKKISLMFLVFSLIFVLPLASAQKDITVLVNTGVAFADLEGLFFDLGAEYNLKENIYLQFVIDYYTYPTGEHLPNGTDSAFGLNLFGVYKYALSNGLTAFGKAGINWTRLKVTGDILGVRIKETSSGPGLGLGGGLELKLNRRIAVLGGLSAKFGLGNSPGTWFKFYMGVNFAVGD